MAIVSGSSEGIGLAIATGLLAEGALVTMSGRNADKLLAAVASVETTARGRVEAVVGDITNAEVREQLVARATDRFGKIDILVNNVGGGSKHRFLEDISDQDVHWTLESNLLSAFGLTRLVVPGMRQRKYGRIVNIASVAGRDRGRLSGPQYAAAKAGMLGMTRHLSSDLGPFGITVNAVAPGFVMTDRARRKWDARSESERIRMLAAVPVGRFGTPDEIASAVLYLASAEAAYTNGVCLDVNGGSYVG